jgi:uncharacterized SAM-binding protein YcdF (DUF218 family)
MRKLPVRVLRAGVAILLLAVFAGVLSFISALTVILTTFNGELDSVPDEVDCAVVFGAAVYGANRPGPAVVRRVAAAAELYSEGRVGRLFLTGGKGGPEDIYSEAEVMRREAILHGVPATDIVIEDQARSTLENIRLTRPLTDGCKSVVAISDQFHMARIRLLAAREGWNRLLLVPAQGRPPYEREVQSVLREVLGYVYYAYHLDVFVDSDQIIQWKTIETL